MCPECGEHLEAMPEFGVWLCPVCDYGETDELHEQREVDFPADPEDGEHDLTSDEPAPRRHATTLQDFEDGIVRWREEQRQNMNELFHEQAQEAGLT